MLNAPLDVFFTDKAEGSLPDTGSVITCSQPNIVIETIKKAEADDSIIVRLYDAFNQKTCAELCPSFDYREVYLCDMLENSLKKLEAENGNVTVNVRNFEIITLKFVR